MDTNTLKRLDLNWERRLRRALKKHGCSLHKTKTAMSAYPYEVRDALTDEGSIFFPSLYKVQVWYESTYD